MAWVYTLGNGNTDIEVSNSFEYLQRAMKHRDIKVLECESVRDGKPILFNKQNVVAVRP